MDKFLRRKVSIALKTNLFIVFVLVAVTACNDKKQYKNAADFEAEIHSWHLNGKPLSEAISILTNKDFVCDEQYCDLNVFKIPCSQTQRIFLHVSDDSKVINTSIWKLKDEKLPSVCL